MLIVNILGLIFWLVLTVLNFCKPKEFHTPNWLMGIIGIGLILDYLGAILKHFVK